MAPDKIRVAQDADGFWTCREAVSGSQQYVRDDIASDLLECLKDARQLLSDHSAIDLAYVDAVIAKATGGAPCEVCGHSPTEAHHDDYCRKHHVEHHHAKAEGK